MAAGCLHEDVCCLMQAMAAAFCQSKRGTAALEASTAAYTGSQHQTDSLVTTR